MFLIQNHKCILSNENTIKNIQQQIMIVVLKTVVEKDKDTFLNYGLFVGINIISE